MTVFEADTYESRLLGVRNWSFWLTLFVTMMLVVLTAYALRDSFLNKSGNASKTPRAVASTHAPRESTARIVWSASFAQSFNVSHER
jgi:hypothetical protein